MSNIKQYEPLWGSWYVDSLIGEGSFGKVYRVRKEEFGSTYYAAVKVISIPQNDADLRQMRSEGLDDASAKSYFHAFVSDIIQEIDLMSEFRGNSNIVSFEDHKVIEKQGEIGWDILIRMELLTSLTDYATEKPLTADDVIKLGIHICKALELCAANNTIHRDIKPDNVFISRYGEYKLGDFGIARQIERTMSGLSKKGTYTYMAPEVFKGEKYGASVDIYSLGIMMYRFLNQNRTPFLPNFPNPITPRNRDEALEHRMRGVAIPPIKGVSGSLNTIVLKACAFDRNARYSSAVELRKALESIMKDTSTPFLNNSSSISAPLIYKTTVAEQTAGVFTDRLSPPIPQKAQHSIEAHTELTDGVFDNLENITEKLIEQKAVVRELVKKDSSVTLWYKAAEMGIDNFADVVLAPNITALDLPGIHIKDISSLDLFERIEFLNLCCNEIEDIGLLSRLTNLSHLFLDCNKIKDISPLLNLNKLKFLTLGDNEISEITALKNMSCLSHLSLGENALTDIGVLQYLNNLSSLSIGGNPISDFSPLRELRNLSKLYLNDRQISDISVLENLSNLTELCLNSNQISDINAIRTLRNLSVLQLSNNQVSSVHALQNLNNLSFLSIGYNKVDDISVLLKLSKLKYLSIIGNPLEENQIVELQQALPDCAIHFYVNSG